MSKTSTAGFNKKVEPKSTYGSPNSAVGADGKPNTFRASQDPAMKEMKDSAPVKQG